MAREKKQRIATDAGPASWNPFASLDLGPLPLQPDRKPPDVPERATLKAKTERLLMRRETAHRGGKTVVVLEGFAASWGEARLGGLLHDLKRALGCAGKVSGRSLELGGELADRLKPLLEARGFAVKRGW